MFAVPFLQISHTVVGNVTASFEFYIFFWLLDIKTSSASSFAIERCKMLTMFEGIGPS